MKGRNMLLLDNVGINKKIKVSITCTVYNHEPYIRRTIESFINQKTSFKYEILLHDDASTDGSREIIKEYFYKYPDKIRVVLQDENQYSKGKNIRHEFLHPLLNGSYIAICEGDDYWPSPDKLQMQFDFLESHKDYSAVCGVTRYFDDKGNEIMNPLPNEKYTGKDAIESNYLNIPSANIASNTLMYRTEYIKEKKYIDAIYDSVKVGDIILILHLFDKGKIYIMNEVFQNHKIQTRKNASNYNTKFDMNSKMRHNVAVVNSVYKNLGKQHDMSLWICHRFALYLIYCLKNKQISDFRECYALLPQKYKKKLILNIIKEYIERIIVIITQKL